MADISNGALVIITAIVCLLAFGFSVVGILVSGNRERTTSADCPSMPANVTYFELTKSIFDVWHWEYDTTVTGSASAVDLSARQACYTLEHDVLLHVDGGLLASSDGKILSTTSDVLINDCHGDRLFKVTTGSFWITLLNTNRILVSYALEDNQGNLLAYVQGTDLFQIMTTYTFQGADGNTVAYAEKDITTFPWTWKVHIYDPASPGADLRALAIVTAHASFSEGGTDDNGKHVDTTDVCNNYVFWTGIAVIIVLILTLAGAVWVFWESVTQCLSWVASVDFGGYCGPSCGRGCCGWQENRHARHSSVSELTV